MRTNTNMQTYPQRMHKGPQVPSALQVYCLLETVPNQMPETEPLRMCQPEPWLVVLMPQMIGVLSADQEGTLSVRKLLF